MISSCICDNGKKSYFRKFISYKNETVFKEFEGIVIGKCENCGKEIDIRSKRCCKCRSLLDNSFKNRNHSKESRKLIGKRSKEKFTEEYMERLRKNHEKRWFEPGNAEFAPASRQVRDRL